MKDESLLVSFLTLIGASKISRSNSNNLKCTCPFQHSNGLETNPSFSISLDEYSKWNCFACGKKGLTFRSLVKAISSEIGHDFSTWENMELTGKEGKSDYSLAKKPFNPKLQDWNNEEQKIFHWNDYEHLTREVPPYAKERGLTDWQIEKWRIGWDKKSNRLFIPIFDHNKGFVGYSGRIIPPHSKDIAKYYHAPGFSKKYYLYGEEYVDLNMRTAILIEGFMDCWALDRVGYNNVFAYMGTSVSDQQLLKLYKWVDDVIIIPDNDKINPATGKSPGYDASKRWHEALLGIGKKAVISPVIKGRKDVADWASKEISYVLQKISVEYSIKLPNRGSNNEFSKT